jgi:hypothetical protein
MPEVVVTYWARVEDENFKPISKLISMDMKLINPNNLTLKNVETLKFPLRRNYSIYDFVWIGLYADKECSWLVRRVPIVKGF